MKNTVNLFLATGLMILLLACSNENNQTTTRSGGGSGNSQANSQGINNSQEADFADTFASKHSYFDNYPDSTGKVVELAEAPHARIMYMKVESDNDVVWLASRHFNVKSGNWISYRAQNAVVQKNLHDNDLNRTFDEIFLVSSVEVTETPDI